MSDFLKSVQELPFLYLTAGYAAVVSTLVLTWDIRKWYANKPNLKLVYSRKLVTYEVKLGKLGSHPASEACTSIRVTNVGSQTTTLNRIVFIGTPRDGSGDVIEQLEVNTLGDTLPFALEAGKQWEGYYPEHPGSPFMTDKFATIRLEVYHTMSEKPSVFKFAGLDLSQAKLD